MYPLCRFKGVVKGAMREIDLPEPFLQTFLYIHLYIFTINEVYSFLLKKFNPPQKKFLITPLCR